MSDGGLGRKIDAARAEREKAERRANIVRSHAAIQAEAAYAQVEAAGREFAKRAGGRLPLEEVRVHAGERRKGLFGAMEDVFDVHRVWVVEYKSRAYVDEAGVVFWGQPTDSYRVSAEAYLARHGFPLHPSHADVLVSCMAKARRERGAA